jgi:hypothetical protein
MTSERFARAASAFDRLNGADPVSQRDGDRERPRLLLQAERLSAWITRLEPDASEALRLAARCQHVERWKIPRESYPAGRSGYLAWRRDLATFHAERAAEVLTAAGYDGDTIAAVERILKKDGLATNPDVQAMEDALCLVFLEHELDAFVAKYPNEAKAATILRKTWRKMSERGRGHALSLPLSPQALALVKRALYPKAG